MDRKLFAGVLIILLAAATATGQEAPSTQPASMTALRVFEILGGSNLLTTREADDYFSSLSGAVGVAAGQLNMDAKDLRRAVAIEPRLVGAQGKCQLQIIVRIPEPGRASEMADAVARACIDWVAVKYEPTPALLKRRDEAKEAVDRADAGLKKMTDALQESTGVVEFTPASMHEATVRLQSEKDSGELNLVAKNARIDALTRAIAKLNDTVKTKVEQDRVAVELEKVVKLREEAVGRLNSADPPSSRDEAIAAAAEARAKLEERRAVAAAAAGADTLTTWNTELLTLTIDLAELRARLDAISNRIHHIRDAAADLPRFAAALEEKQRAEKVLEGIQFWVKSREENPSENSPPEFVLIRKDD